MSVVPAHELLLGVAGRVDDDLLAWARELIAVGEEGRAIELLVAALVADTVALPAPVRAGLVTAARSARSVIDADGALPPADDRATAHVFERGDAEAADAIARAARELLDRVECRAWVTWRRTPAGSASGPLPHPVLLVELGDPDGADVLAYQLGTVLERAGTVASVEVFTGGTELPAYHVAARQAARLLHVDAAGRSARTVTGDATVPPETVDAQPADTAVSARAEPAAEPIDETGDETGDETCDEMPPGDQPTASEPPASADTAAWELPTSGDAAVECEEVEEPGRFARPLSEAAGPDSSTSTPGGDEAALPPGPRAPEPEPLSATDLFAPTTPAPVRGLAEVDTGVPRGAHAARPPWLSVRTTGEARPEPTPFMPWAPAAPEPDRPGGLPPLSVVAPRESGAEYAAEAPAQVSDELPARPRPRAGAPDLQSGTPSDDPLSGPLREPLLDPLLDPSFGAGESASLFTSHVVGTAGFDPVPGTHSLPDAPRPERPRHERPSDDRGARSAAGSARPGPIPDPGRRHRLGPVPATEPTPEATGPFPPVAAEPNGVTGVRPVPPLAPAPGGTGPQPVPPAEPATPLQGEPIVVDPRLGLRPEALERLSPTDRALLARLQCEMGMRPPGRAPEQRRPSRPPRPRPVPSEPPDIAG